VVALTNQPHGELGPLQALVIHPSDHDGEMLLRGLQRIGCHCSQAWPPPDELPPQLDVVFYQIDQRTRGPFHWLNDRPAVATIAIVGQGGPTILQAVGDCMPQAILTKPFDSVGLLTNLLMARNNFRYERRLLTKIGKLEETLRAIRKVEQAKSILMKKRGIDEPEAYEYLRRQAMRKRVPVGSVAAAIIDADEMLGSE
jgi:AmiR/NasT family two-component response regulator